MEPTGQFGTCVERWRIRRRAVRKLESKDKTCHPYSLRFGLGPDGGSEISHVRPRHWLGRSSPGQSGDALLIDLSISATPESFSREPGLS
jgi:hypothetical protein